MLFSSVLEHSTAKAAVLPLLRACKSIRELNQVHSRIIREGCDQDHFLIAQFISICTVVEPSNYSYPTSVFHAVISPNMYLWNILMKIQCDHSSLNECFSVFGRMRRDWNAAPDKYTFPSLIKTCCHALALREGMAVHGMTVRVGIDGDLFVGSSLVDFYGKCGAIEFARTVFDGMSVRNEVAWTAMMVGYFNLGLIDEAKNLFDEMPNRNEATWNAVIKGLVKSGDLNSARKMFDEMPVKSEVSFTTLIDGYAKAGDMEAARLLFDALPWKDLVAWSALMTGYVQNGRPREAVLAFVKLQAMNVKPDKFIMVSLMCACSQLGSSELAGWIDSQIHNGPFDPRQPRVATPLVDMHVKCGNMDRAVSLFNEMPKRNLIMYCSMIQGLCLFGRGSEAVALFDRMINHEGILPDQVAFTIILTACSYAGLVDDGCRLFNIMTQTYAISPSPDHYACMVNLLGKAGKVGLAYELIRSMPVESHAGAWGSLLGACRLQGNIDLGEEVAARLFEIEPRSGGNYVLLSSIYAEAERWLSVSCLRDKMDERGIKKIPGYSYVDPTMAS